MDKKLHYNILYNQHQQWAQEISKGNTTVNQPPLSLYQFWLKEQGAISRESKAPARRNFQQETRNSFETLQEQLERSRVESEIRAQRDKDEERQWRRGDREEARERKREEEEYRRQLRRDEEDMRRQQ